MFSSKPYDRDFLERVDREPGFGHELVFYDARLELATAPLAHGSAAVCAFVNDDLGRPVLADLAAHGTRLVALRSAGFNNVDLSAAGDLGLTVTHVPDYSPYAVAEFTIALALALNRHLSRAYTHVREGNFSLQGLLGFDLHGKTAGIVGTGKIGGIVAETLLRGFGCRVLAHDLFPSDRLAGLGVEYVGLADLLRESDLVSLHCPLTPETHHLIELPPAHGLRQRRGRQPSPRRPGVAPGRGGPGHRRSRRERDPHRRQAVVGEGRALRSRRRGLHRRVRHADRRHRACGGEDGPRRRAEPGRRRPEPHGLHRAASRAARAARAHARRDAAGRRSRS